MNTYMIFYQHFGSKEKKAQIIMESDVAAAIKKFHEDYGKDAEISEIYVKL